MKKALQVVNDLEKNGVIEGYAMGGATALLFYAEPALTFDVDIFIFLPGDKGPKRLVNLGPLYKALESCGYHPEKEHVLIAGIPVQFIPVYNELVKEAVEKAIVKEYEGVKIKVMKIEYLLAIMADTNRPKDRERINNLLDNVQYDTRMFDEILKRHLLQKKWDMIVEKKQDKN